MVTTDLAASTQLAFEQFTEAEIAEAQAIVKSYTDHNDIAPGRVEIGPDGLTLIIIWEYPDSQVSNTFFKVKGHTFTFGFTQNLDSLIDSLCAKHVKQERWME